MQPTSDISLITTDWSTHRQPLMSVRTRVFIEEQDIPADLEWDEYDAISWHCLAVVENHSQAPQYIGTGRLQPNGKITRIAVLPEWRRRGVANGIVSTLLTLANQHKLPDLFLHAQTTAQGLYKKHGFIACGEEFDEGGIAHIAMHKR